MDDHRGFERGTNSKVECPREKSNESFEGLVLGAYPSSLERGRQQLTLKTQQTSLKYLFAFLTPQNDLPPHILEIQPPFSRPSLSSASFTLEQLLPLSSSRLSPVRRGLGCFERSGRLSWLTSWTKAALVNTQKVLKKDSRQ